MNGSNQFLAPKRMGPLTIIAYTKDFYIFQPKFPRSEMGVAPHSHNAMGCMMVLSQNGWVQSISGLKKHRNRAPTWHNTIHIGFSYFPAKIPMPGNGGRGLKWVIWWFYHKIDGFNRFLASRIIGIEPPHAIIWYTQNFYIFRSKFPRSEMGDRGVVQKWVIWWFYHKIDGLNRFLASKNIGIEPPHAIIAYT